MIATDKQLFMCFNFKRYTKSNVNVLQFFTFIWCLNLYIMVYKYFFLQERQKPN